MDQDCGEYRISCELGRIADLLAEPDLFDYLSGIVVPILLGLATLILAIFTITTARRANKIAVELEKDRQAREDRSARRAIVPELVDWASLELLLPAAPGDTAHSEKLAAARKLREHRQRLGDPSLDTLMNWVQKRVEKSRDIPADDPDHQGVAMVYGDLQKVIQEWAEDSDSIKRRYSADIMQEAFKAAIEKMRADREETIRLASDMLRRSRGDVPEG